MLKFCSSDSNEFYTIPKAIWSYRHLILNILIKMSTISPIHHKRRMDSNKEDQKLLL